MAELYLIRHGMTKGNEERRYIGRTDEGLSEKGVREITQHWSPYHPQLCGEKRAENWLLFSSPLRRCIETAELLFPDSTPIRIPAMQETDFGRFEYRTAEELSGDADYQKWLDSMGTLPFPEGESMEETLRRAEEGLQEIVRQMQEMRSQSASLITHGGIIMHLLDRYTRNSSGFYSYHVANGCGYHLEFDDTQWKTQPVWSRSTPILGPGGNT